jgi:hypothetical protein
MEKYATVLVDRTKLIKPRRTQAGVDHSRGRSEQDPLRNGDASKKEFSLSDSCHEIADQPG